MKESDCRQHTDENTAGMSEIRCDRKELQEMMRTLDKRKAAGPDGVVGHTLEECNQELTEPVHDIPEALLRKGKSQESGKERIEFLFLDQYL